MKKEKMFLYFVFPKTVFHSFLIICRTLISMKVFSLISDIVIENLKYLLKNLVIQNNGDYRKTNETKKIK